ncbi:alpha/beta hydrolase fold domain-containing protein [Sphaerisporangium corydalis]|uniref:Alpha/beta hydrolase fold domain-containing protein n=1 Tax=Sphaerisporangium corydalis TaxID=1441875 RepID=A0ABV9E9N6_9ACTN|nr:alpha/beta hydrolase fold domain-containing protein [Sphaerisporangium corydalis]
MRQDIDVDVHPAYPMSWRASVFNGLMRGTTKPMSALLLRHTAVMSLVSRLVAMGERLPLPAPAGVSIVKEDADPCGSEWVRAGADLDEDKVLLYFHGGGYFFCSPATHRPITWRLSAAARRPVLALDYRQGPAHSLAQSLADALGAYQGLLDKGYRACDILLAGDSAGGHLTLATLLALRDRGLPEPAAAVCLSPWADLSDGGRRANRWADPMLTASRVDWLARRWTAGLDPRDPLVSPVYGDYTGLPPLMVVTGSTEVLRDEGRRVAARARGAGVRVTYEEWHRMPHVFAILADILPEARLVFGHIQRFLDAVAAADPAAASTAPAAGLVPAPAVPGDLQASAANPESGSAAA